MTYYLDPKRNLIAQLSVFCAADGSHYTGSELQEEENNDDVPRIGDSNDETGDQDGWSLGSSEVVHQATVQAGPCDTITESVDAAFCCPFAHKVDLSYPQTRYLKRKDDVQKLLIAELEDNGFKAEFNSEMTEVKIVTLESCSVTPVQNIINDIVGVVDMDISRQVLYTMPDIHARDVLKEEEQVMVIADSKRDSFKLVGPQPVVEVIGRRLSKGKQLVVRQCLAEDHDGVYSSFLSESESIKLNESCFKYLRKHKWEDISKLNETYEYVCVQGVEERGEYVILVEGPIEAVQKATACIKDIVSQLKTTQFRLLSRSGTANWVLDLTPHLEESHRCVMSFMSNVSDVTPVKYPGNEKKTKVRVQIGELQKTAADVLVNTTNTKLDLETGWGLSTALAKAGGPGIEKELKLSYPDGIAHGEVAVSGPGKLTNCKEIYHGALPPYKQGRDYSYQILVMFMINCLQRANSAGYKSIAFPGLGTGVLQYPLQNVAQLMHQTVVRFLESTASLHLEEIVFVIYPSANHPVKQTFIMENLSARVKSLIVDEINPLHEELQTPDRICCEARLPVGRNHIQVFNCDVTTICDVTKNVLILWRRDDLAENKGTPFLALVAPTINENFNKDLVFGTKDTKCVLDRDTTQEYTLIHTVYMDDDRRHVVDAVERALKRARKENILSLTVPCFEDGIHTWYPSNAASIVMDAVRKFNSTDVCISIVIPSSQTFRNFVRTEKLQVPQNTKAIVESVWASQKSVIPGDTVVFVTSESEVINQDAAENLARQLQMQIVYTVLDYNTLIST